MAFEATWRMTLEDFKVLTAAHKRRKRSETFIRYADPIALGVAGVVAAVFLAAGDWSLGLLSLGYVFFLLALRYVVEPMVTRRRFMAQRLHENDLHLHADEDGLRITSADTDTTLRWNGIVRVDRQDGRTILWSKGVAGVAIPDRGFSSPDIAQAFAAFSTEQVHG